MQFKLYFFIFIIFNLLSISCFAHEAEQKKTYMVFEYNTPKPIPEDKFLDAKGVEHSLEEYENNVVLINFWATWCTFCVNKMKSLDKFQKFFSKQPVKVLAISQDFKGVPIVDGFYKKKKIKHLDIYVDKKNTLFKAFNVIALPTSILIDGDGHEVARIVGVVDWINDESLKRLIQKYLSKIK